MRFFYMNNKNKLGRQSSNNVLASCRSKLSLKTVGMLLLLVLAGPLLQFRSLQAYLSNESFTKKVKKAGGAHNVVEEGSKKSSDGVMMTKRLRNHGSSNDDSTKSKKAKFLTLDTKIVSFILLSLMTVIVIPKFLRLPGNITWQSILAQFCTSLMFHFQGLLTLQANDGRTLAMLKGVAGAGLEGIFLLSLMIMLLSKRRLWANVLVCVLGIVSIMCLYFSATFMRKTGSPTLPEMSMVISGLRDARSYIKAEGKDDMRGMIKGLLGAYVLSGVPSAILVWSVGRRDDNATVNNRRALNVEQHHLSKEQRRRSVLYFSVVFMTLAIFYSYDAWAPIFHIYASVCGSFIFPPPGGSEAYIETIEQGKQAATADGTNLILLIHESLSGEYAMTRKEAVESMPFLQKKFQSNDGDFFVFENARTVSGDTRDCVPAILSGCLPLNKKEGTATAYSTNMATQAKMRGYQTLSFSSRALNMKSTIWWMIQNALSISFDRIWHPGVTGEPHVNEAAQSDRLMGKNFGSWIREWSQNTTKTPFFAQFYYFDAHHPYYSDNKTFSNRLDDRLNEMLTTVDKGIEDIFGYLDDAGQLDNTIVVASGDHGDMYTEQFGRLHSWDADVLRPLMYIYVPKRLSAKYPEIVTNLNHNRQQLVSTLDLFPTMLHMLDGISSKNDYNGVADFNCMRGYDLLSKKIDSERVASWSFPSDLYSNGGNIGVHYRRSSLVNRFGWPKRNRLKVVTYNKTIGSLTENEKEVGDDVVLTFDEWKSLVLVKGTNGVHGLPNVAMNSPYMKYLLDSLDRSAETTSDYDGPDDEDDDEAGYDDDDDERR